MGTSYIFLFNTCERLLKTSETSCRKRNAQYYTYLWLKYEYLEAKYNFVKI